MVKNNSLEKKLVHESVLGSGPPQDGLAIILSAMDRFPNAAIVNAAGSWALGVLASQSIETASIIQKVR